MNTANLIETCYNAAKEKGFWDTERNMPEAFALIISGLYEAFEAHRKGRFAELQVYLGVIKDRNDLIQERNFALNENRENLDFFVPDFEVYIKDTLEDELADVLIRIFDFCGGYVSQKDFDFLNNHLQLDLGFKNITNIGEKVLRITYISTVAYYNISVFSALQKIYNNVMYMCQELNIDIETHINLKLAYNAMLCGSRKDSKKVIQ